MSLTSPTTARAIAAEMRLRARSIGMPPRDRSKHHNWTWGSWLTSVGQRGIRRIQTGLSGGPDSRRGDSVWS